MWCTVLGRVPFVGSWNDKLELSFATGQSDRINVSAVAEDIKNSISL